jgi:DNA processing protein
LVKDGVIIVSGLSRGIYSVAHKSAIEAGGDTVAVLGTPLNRFYPKENHFSDASIVVEASDSRVLYI